MTENTENTSPQINVADLANVVNIIDYASSKGAFTGPDIEFVGKIRNRLQAFVESVAPPKDEQKDETKTEVVDNKKKTKKVKAETASKK